MPAALSAASISLPPPWTITSGTPCFAARAMAETTIASRARILEQLAAELQDDRPVDISALHHEH